MPPLRQVTYVSGAFASQISLFPPYVVDPLVLISKCQSIGYAMDTIVEIPGSMSRRGGILDIFSRNYEMPVRVEFYGNQIDSIRFYDPKTQRSIATVSSNDIVPSDEDNMSSDQGTIFDYMPQDTCLVLDDREGIENAVQRINEQWYEFLQSDGGENPEKNRCPAYMTMDIFFRNIEKFDRRLTLVPWFTDVLNTSDVLVWPFASLQNYGGRYDSFIEDIVHIPAAYNRVLIISQQPERLNELLLEHDVIASFVEKIVSVPAERSLLLMRGSLSEGWLLKDTLAVFTDREIFGVIKQRRLSRKRPIRHHTFTSQFTEGDYVVHVDHGIARFSGIVKRTLNGSEKEYLTLQYEGDDILFVPVDQVDRISRYIGSSDHPPVLSHFGTQEWMKIKARVGRSVIDMAKKLLDLYAARETADGYSFSGDSLWQQELEMAFSYTETPDQLSAIDAVKRDMESSRPMDRLVCGDVGYGKTEVALRAAFKAVMDNKQVAVLVPTTILAQQHYTTFTERLKAFPARIKVLSRFCSPVEEKQIVRELSEGQVDICIGTHRLLQKDIHFKSLGLVVVDEEQRFGVVHKEHLKDLSRGVDVLTLSATPIPRTLHMSLIGIRDMSTIETPPEERLPITTYVGRYDERIIREAILRELERKGQVFFVHNRVFDIEGIARNIIPLFLKHGFSMRTGKCLKMIWNMSCQFLLQKELTCW
jgi:transcription-repair coupling factor (superfamily II helicase)